MTEGDMPLRIISTNLIPLLFTLIAPFYDLFSSIFIKDQNFFQEHRKYISYFIVGQSFIIGYLAVLIKIIDYFFYGHNFDIVRLLFLSLYLACYLIFVILYLKMGADGYDSQVLLVKFFYALTPALVMILTIIFSIIRSIKIG